MPFRDSYNIIKKMAGLSLSDKSQEHCAVAVASVQNSESAPYYMIEDFCMVEEVGGSTTKHCSVIPAGVSYTLLRYCSKAGKVPVIIHTHIRDLSDPECEAVSFSRQDMKFMEWFSDAAKEQGGISNCCFIVHDGKSIMECCVELDCMEYVFSEGKEKV